MSTHSYNGAKIVKKKKKSTNGIIEENVWLIERDIANNHIGIQTSYYIPEIYAWYKDGPHF